MKVANNGLTIVVGGALGHFPEKFVVSALEKQIPKKPKDHPLSDGKCPCCNAVFDYDWKPKSKFCQNCGQALDWGDDNG